MVKLDAQLDLVIRAAWADSSLKMRNSQWKKYLEFCNANSLTPIPGEVLSVARFLVNLGLTSKYSTCNNYLSAIIALHKFFGYPGDFRQSFVVQMIMKGLGRRLGKHVDQKIGLSPTQLILLYRGLDYQTLM